MERTELDVRAFSYDSWNEAHMLVHDVVPADLDAVLEGRPRFFTNLPGRSAPYVMIAPDAEGRFYVAPIIWTREEGVWYPLTAWRMNSRRAGRLYESR